MSRLAQALRSLRSPVDVATEVPERSNLTRPRRRNEHAILGSILKRLTLLSPTETVPADPPADRSAASLTHVETEGPVEEVLIAPQPRLDSTTWETAIASDLARPAVEEGYRHLVSRLLQDFPAGVPQSVLLAGVGCASAAGTIGRLAWLLAEERGPVLLVDADLARTSLTLQLGAAGQAGFHEIVRGEPATPHTTSQPGLSILPAGNGQTVHLTASSRVAAALSTWRSSYPLVLIDGGEALSDSAEVLARMCDATYLLVGLGTATTEMARTATSRFRTAGGRVLGCVAIQNAGIG